MTYPNPISISVWRCHLHKPQTVISNLSNGLNIARERATHHIVAPIHCADLSLPCRIRRGSEAQAGSPDFLQDASARTGASQTRVPRHDPARCTSAREISATRGKGKPHPKRAPQLIVVILNRLDSLPQVSHGARADDVYSARPGEDVQIASRWLLNHGVDASGSFRYGGRIRQGGKGLRCGSSVETGVPDLDRPAHGQYWKPSGPGDTHAS